MLSFVWLLAIQLCFLSCSNNKNANGYEENADSVALRLRLIDSLRNSGTYHHLEGWNIGRIVDNGYKKYEILADRHSVDINVNKLSLKTDTFYFLQLTYWESSSYTERVEAKLVDIEELKYFYSAIDDIKKQYGKDTDHYERYEYQTKSGVVLSLRRLINSDYWELKFCSIDISKDDLDELRKILKQTENKIEELKKSSAG